MTKRLPKFRRPFRLRTILALAFAAQVALVLIAAGYYAQFQLRRVIEREIDSRITTYASLAAASLAKIPFLSVFPPDPDSRMAQFVQQTMQGFLAQTRIARIVITDPNGRVFYDSRQQLLPGQEYVRARIDRLEFQQAAAGQPAAAPFFEDASGAPFKAAYAPLTQGDRVLGVVCVEARAESLAALRETRRLFWTIGVVVVLVTVGLAAGIAFTITRPLEKLRRAAEAIASGQYDLPIEARGSSETVVLANTLETMREAVLRREQQLHMMLMGIAHEIRNPLGGMELFAGLLEKQCDSKLRPHVEKIKTEIRTLKNIINDFLNYARPARPNKACVAAAAIVEEARSMLGRQADAVQWEFQVEDDCRIDGDPEQLRQVFLNLLQNGCQAVAEQEDAQIRIRIQKNEQECECIIQDNGPGIAEKDVERIFEPFFTTRHQGTGLGLALVKQYVEANGGRVAVTEWRDGATFRVWLPLCRHHGETS